MISIERFDIKILFCLDVLVCCFVSFYVVFFIAPLMLQNLHYAPSESPVTEPTPRHDRMSQPAGTDVVTLAPEGLIDALGLPPGVEDAVLDITPPHDLGRAADFD